MNNLEIFKEILQDEIVVFCKGRLDANHAVHFNDFIERLVREGNYIISVNLAGVEYLSSAGIRSLVGQYKNLKAINGHFCIIEMSENVHQVLNMVGMANMLSQPLPKKVIEGEKPETLNDFIDNGIRYSITELNIQGKTNVFLNGNPEIIRNAAYKAENTRLIKASDNSYAIGLGAIGDSFQDCQNRFGEYILLGKNSAYLPADGSKKPDYMVNTGKLIASLTELYGLHFNGNFSFVVRFDPVGEQQSVELSQLINSIAKHSNLDNWAFVMIAESGGLIGASLNSSPVSQQKIFSFPEIKDTINFTTEPAHNKMLTISVGITSKSDKSKKDLFLRPLKQNSDLLSHVHTAVFPYTPLKKTEIDLTETIDYLFNSSELIDILHLTNDTREIVGLGESQFIQGFCWVTPIESFIDNNNPTSAE